MKKELLREIKKKRKGERYTLKKEVGDLFDQANTEMERELTYLLGDIERDRLKSINEALEKIDEGKYGLCEECGEKIPKKRLQTMPFAKFCVHCQTRLEGEVKEVGMADYKDQYSRLGKLSAIEDE